MNRITWNTTARLLSMALLLVVAAACASPATPTTAQPADRQALSEAEHDDAHDTGLLAPASLAEGEKLNVVATTNIVGDVVGVVGGEHIVLSQLLPIGSDPHSYQARPDDLRRLNSAHVVFANGLHLEEAMEPVLDGLDNGAPVVSVNNGVPTLELGEGTEESEHGADDAGDHDHKHEGADPHTWMDVQNVKIWVDNIASTLSALDPAHAEAYTANAVAYQAQLDELDQEIAASVASIPADRRKLVTDHENLGYFANAYGLTTVGAVIPSLSTLAAPSAQELAALQTQIAEEGVPAIFVGTTVNPDVAAQVAADTGVEIVPIYTGSLSDAGGPAATYTDMMRHTVSQIVAALE